MFLLLNLKEEVRNNLFSFNISLPTKSGFSYSHRSYSSAGSPLRVPYNNTFPILSLVIKNSKKIYHYQIHLNNSLLVNINI